MVSEPLNLFDIAPNADGAAALVLTRRELLPSNFAHPLVKISGSASASDTLALHDRKDMLYFETAQLSANKAIKQAGITLDQINFFEYHDMFSIYAALQLEAIGFAIKGQRLEARGGWRNCVERKNPLRHHGRTQSTRFSGRRKRRVSSCRSGDPVTRSSRSESDRGRKIWIDPIPRRAGIHGSLSCFGEVASLIGFESLAG